MRKLLMCFWGIVSTTVWISCNGPEERQAQSSKGLYYFTNFDQYYGFLEPYALIKTNLAHSGDYITKADTTRETSFIFYRYLNEISNKKINRIDVSCWLYSEMQYPECSIVCSADSALTKVYYFEAADVKNEMNSIKQWTKISASFYLPDTIPPEAQIRVYMLNKSKITVFMDDFAIQFFEKK